MEEYENRPPYDPTDTIQFFEEIYRMKLKNCSHTFPEWILESVNHRLLALDYLPEDAFIRYRREIRSKKKQWAAINRMAEKEEKKQHIPQRLLAALTLHDANLLSLKKEKKNLVMLVTKDGGWPDDYSPYRKVVFQSAEVLEKDPGLQTKKYISLADGFYISNVTFICSEVYQSNEQYEIHMMSHTPRGLAYLTV